MGGSFWEELNRDLPASPAVLWIVNVRERNPDSKKKKKKTLLHYVSQVDGFEMFVDFPGYENPSNVFYDAVRPDLILKWNHHIIVIELTYCFVTSLVHSRNFKNQKYKNIKIYGKVTVNKTETFFLEMPSLGFIAKTFKHLEKFLLKSNINCNRLKQKNVWNNCKRFVLYLHS